MKQRSESAANLWSEIVAHTGTALRRLLEIRTELNQVLERLHMDTLLTSNWAKTENLVKLLEPFAIHTDQLQSDSDHCHK